MRTRGKAKEEEEQEKEKEEKEEKEDEEEVEEKEETIKVNLAKTDSANILWKPPSRPCMPEQCHLRCN
ncbi:hypothetical protein M0804_005911 [Polistes exclamans]|nr:hypothetical protein M0804_005911 [Polistes exclamans]